MITQPTLFFAIYLVILIAYIIYVFSNRRRLKKHIFNTTGHKVDDTVDEPDNSDEDNPHLPPVKRMRTAERPAKRPGPKSSKKTKRRKTASSETPAVVPKLRLNLAASGLKTSTAGPSSPTVQGELQGDHSACAKPPVDFKS